MRIRHLTLSDTHQNTSLQQNYCPHWTTLNPKPLNESVQRLGFRMFSGMEDFAEVGPVAAGFPDLAPPPKQKTYIISDAQNSFELPKQLQI